MIIFYSVDQTIIDKIYNNYIYNRSNNNKSTMYKKKIIVIINKKKENIYLSHLFFLNKFDI